MKGIKTEMTIRGQQKLHSVFPLNGAVKAKSLIVEIRNANYIFFIVLLFILIACENNTIEMKQKKLNQFGLDYTNAWNSQKPENVASFFSEEGSLIVNRGEPFKGRKEITAFTKGFMDAFPDLELTMDSLVTKSTFTDYHWSFVGTNTGQGGTGNKVVFSGFEQWTFDEDGLIKVSIGTFDQDEYSRQVNGE